MRAIWFAIRTGLLDMRHNLRRFTLVVACLAVGTALIAGVNSVGASIQQTVEHGAAGVLGGDVQITRAERPATPEQLETLATFGKVVGVVDTNVTATGANGETAFVDLSAVGDGYPLIGRVDSPQLPEGTNLYEFLAPTPDGIWGTLVDPLMLDELHARVGDTIGIGGTAFQVRGILDGLPDGAVRGFRLGRLAVITFDALGYLADRTSPLPGLGTWFRYKVLLSGQSPEDGKAAIEAALNDPTWTIQTARESLGPMVRYYDLFMRFLVIVGLSALFVGGVSVSNSMTAYVNEQSNTVAILRSLGATSTRIFIHFFSQITALALGGVLIGLVIGGGIALIALPIVGAAIGVPLAPALHVAPLLTAALVGLLTAFAFAYLPLQQAQTVRPALLFRTRGLTTRKIDWRAVLLSFKVVPLVVAIALLAWLAVIIAGDPTLVAAFALICAVSVAFFRLALWIATHLVKRAGNIPNRILRHALRDIAGPGSTAASVVISVGLVVATLIMVQALGVNLRNEYLGASVFDAPSFVASDLFEDEAATVSTMMQDKSAGIADFAVAPMLRGSLSAVNGVPVEQLTPRGPEASFLVSGDIPMTYRTAMPTSSRLTDGAWWPTDYQGTPLVSLHRNLRAGLGLKLGDTLTFTIFGDEVTARVANFRDYSWQGGIDFLVTFSPGVVEAYPATLLGAVTAVPGQEDSVERALAAKLPDVRFIAIGETLVKITAALGQLSMAVLFVGGLAVGNGLLTLLGSLAAGRQQRRNDAVVNKVLGATRGQVLAVSVVRYIILAAFAAVLATPIGIGLAWALTSILLEVEFTVDAGILAAFDVVAIVITGILGATTIVSALTVPPAMLLRQMGVR